MTSDQIRQSFLDFFKSKQHAIVPSASLMPDAPNLLFTNAGMNQFVPYFLGERESPNPRIADTQKCIRAGGKHNDLEDVGLDTYHHTFFEMLGNWSIGDYFKQEAIEWAWELITEVWKFPKERLYATVYKPGDGDPATFDQEAYDYWKAIFEKAGLDPKVHIIYGNKKDNFWMMGDTGPCGPCSELHVDLTAAGDTKGKLVNADSPYCIEIWNLVFIQFNATPDGNYVPLKNQHVDTGMGFERVAGIVATTKNFTDFSSPPSNYNSDLFTTLFDQLTELSGHKYAATMPADVDNVSETEMKDVIFRVLADHARCLSCAIADGILPGNEGRNYVLRRILRRAVMYGRKLGLENGFFSGLVPVVVAQLGHVFPELQQQQEVIQKIIKSEEDAFGRTLDRGMQLFEQEIRKLGSASVPLADSGVSPESSTASPDSTRYHKRRLPHFERPWGKYTLTFSTADRATLSEAERQIVLEAAKHLHEEGKIHLYLVCVMPDHVHLLLEPQPKGKDSDDKVIFHSLPEISHSLKSYTAHAINDLRGTSGPIWHKEYHDRLVRSESDLQEKFEYIQANPNRAGLVENEDGYPFVWAPSDETAARRDAEQSPRDAGGTPVFPGEVAFTLYDTYGFPLDLTQLLAKQKGLTVDTDGFEAQMEKQRQRARASQKKTDILVADSDASAEATKFIGFDTLADEAELLEVVKGDDDSAYLVFNHTPFYAEMGGQVGDTGAIEFEGEHFDVLDTVKDASGRHLHKVTGDVDAIAAGHEANLIVDVKRRKSIERHHSATHVLHWALRKVLGSHVRQAGSYVGPDRLRFDFSHFEAIKPDQLALIEKLCNEQLLANSKVVWFETPFDEKPDDVIAFFGEKYGDVVRVVDIGGFSRELCGGTHVRGSGEIGLLKIVSESAIAAGTRRIEAIVGDSLYSHINDVEATIATAARSLSVPVGELVKRVDTLIARNAELEKQLKRIQQKAAGNLADELLQSAKESAGLKLVAAKVDASDPNALRQLGANLIGKLGEGVVVLGAEIKGKVSIVAFCSQEAITKGHKAGDIIRDLTAKLDGRGGGKPDFAMGGAANVAALESVLKSFSLGRA